MTWEREDKITQQDEVNNIKLFISDDVGSLTTAVNTNGAYLILAMHVNIDSVLPSIGHI